MASGITDHDLHEVEAKLVKTLGRAVMPPELWGRLIQGGYVLPVVREGYDGPEWDELVGAAREFTKEKREEALGTNLPPDRRDRRPRDIAGVRLDGYTRLRAETFSEVAGALANRRTEVRTYRVLYLGGTESWLTDDEAGAWIYGREAPTNALEDMWEVSRRLSRAFRWRTDDARLVPAHRLRSLCSAYQRADASSQHPRRAELLEKGLSRGRAEFECRHGGDRYHS